MLFLSYFGTLALFLRALGGGGGGGCCYTLNRDHLKSIHGHMMLWYEKIHVSSMYLCSSNQSSCMQPIPLLNPEQAPEHHPDSDVQGSKDSNHPEPIWTQPHQIMSDVPNRRRENLHRVRTT